MRPESLFPLFADIATLKGVGTVGAAALKRLKITRMRDLLFHAPSGWLRRIRTDRLTGDLVGQLVSLETESLADWGAAPRAGAKPQRFWRQDGQGQAVALVYFHTPNPALATLLRQENRLLVSGLLERFGETWQIVHPDYVGTLELGPPLIEPVYPLTAGLAGARLRAVINRALDKAPALPEWIDPALQESRRWPDWRAALIALHSDPNAALAQERLAYDEALATQAALTLIRQRTRTARAPVLAGTTRLTAALIAALPYALTGAQGRACAEIAADLARPVPMLRLLQGDVGAGKTLVAALAMVQAVEAGAQAALLAPTEILARQHLRVLETVCAPLGVRVALLTGREKGAKRTAILAALAAGEIDILIGTHAIFQAPVDYATLGLVVIDEQHRFGVHQRALLSDKGRVGTLHPHLLMLSATPIPRSMALAAYGELDISTLDEKPPGRQPIDTRVISLDRLADVVAGLKRALAEGAQAYWVCPLVAESEVSDLAAAEQRAQTLEAVLEMPVGLAHGRLSGAEKDAAMDAFASGQTRVLVATTVIEVGVDVPNATLMIIEHAERFGLAQLHQLRGRVGRGSARSTCLLLRGTELGEGAATRLALMRESEDGFYLAEQDLKLRGAGDMLGAKQSGLPDYHFLNLAEQSDLLRIAQKDARVLLERDPGLTSPRGQALRTLLYLHERDAAIRLLRGG